MRAPRKPGEPLTMNYIPSATIEPVISVSDSDPLARAISQMRLGNYSQLPVTRGSKSNHAKGVITWESIGKGLAINSDSTLHDCIEADVPSVALDSDLLDAIDIINDRGYVLVTKLDKSISGIVTSADLGAELDKLARPILLLERLEDGLRKGVDRLRITNKLTKEDIHRAAPLTIRNSDDDASSYPMGDLISIVSDEAIWNRFKTGHDRSVITDALARAVTLRNKLMHFRELSADDYHTLDQLPGLVTIMEEVTAGKQL